MSTMPSSFENRMPALEIDIFLDPNRMSQWKLRPALWVAGPLEDRDELSRKLKISRSVVSREWIPPSKRTKCRENRPIAFKTKIDESNRAPGDSCRTSGLST